MLISAMAASVFAAPATPEKVRIKQPDGSFVEVYVRGDEYLNYYENAADGSLMQRSADGFIRRVADQEAFRRKLPALYAERKMRKADTGGRLAPGGAPAPIPVDFPTKGKVKGLVLLVEYQDVKFSENAKREIYDELLNSDSYTGDLATGSVKQYFKDQSDGQFITEFDVAGPFCLDHPMAYYGKGSGGGELVAEMFEEGCNQADAQGVDFTQYDSNNDGIVDFVFVVYAGYGEAQGGPQESVWPQQVDLYYQVWSTYDGMYLNKGACSCELHGNTGSQIDGIGTICHEFSHVLGLPDVYDVFYMGSYGMGHWDVMDIGSYNNDSRTPANYTALDKYTVGWLTPTVLTSSQNNLALNPFGTSNEAYFVVSGADQNEYYTLENRQQEGWDAGLAGHGLLMSHVTYDAVAWKSNVVNSGKNPFDRVALVSADNTQTLDSEDGDVYPGVKGVTEFSPATTPAQKWRTAGADPFWLSGITETDGVISFNFDTGAPSSISMPFIDADLNGNVLSVSNPRGEEVAIYGIDGTQVAKSSAINLTQTLAKGVYVLKSGRRSVKIMIK